MNTILKINSLTDGIPYAMLHRRGEMPMPTIAITAARDNLYKLVEQVNQTREPVIITNAKGENAVLLAEKDYLALQETLSLLGDKETYNRLLSEYSDADFIDVDEALADVERDHR